jgi:hypothetical protein
VLSRNLDALQTYSDLHFVLIGTTEERPVVMQVLGDIAFSVGAQGITATVAPFATAR